MAAVGAKRVNVSDDEGLQELVAFIKDSLSGEKKYLRKLTANQSYSFTVVTRLSEDTFDEYGVKVSEGTSLRLFTQSSPGAPTNPNIFMFDDGNGAWYVDIATGLVRHFAENINISTTIISPVFSAKTSSTGYRRL